jgi:hypothetical protein
MNKNKELPATELLTNTELTIYDYRFDIKDVKEKLLICEFDKVPYNIGNKLITALLINVFEKEDNKIVDKGVIKSRNEDTDTVEILTQKGVVKKNTIKNYFAKVVPAYVIKQQIPKWVDTNAFITDEISVATLNYIIDPNYSDGYMKWSLTYIEEKERRKIAVGNDNFSKGIAFIEKENSLFKRGEYELEVNKYTSNGINNGKVVVKWDLELDTSDLTNLNSI